MDNMSVTGGQGPGNSKPLDNVEANETSQASELAQAVFANQTAAKGAQSIDTNVKVLSKQIEVMPYATPITKSENFLLYKMKRAFKTIAGLLGFNKKEKIDVARSILNMVAPDIESGRDANKHAVRGMIAYYENQLKEAKNAAPVEDQKVALLKQTIDSYKFYEKVEKQLGSIQSSKDVKKVHKSIQKDLVKKLASLDDNERVLVPLYYCDATGPQEGHFEITKQDQKFCLRVVSPNINTLDEQQGSSLKDKYLPFVQFDGVAASDIVSVVANTASCYRMHQEGVKQMALKGKENEKLKKAEEDEDQEAEFSFKLLSQVFSTDKILDQIGINPDLPFDILQFIEATTNRAPSTVQTILEDGGSIESLSQEFVSAERQSNIRKKMLHGLRGASKEEYDKVTIELQYQSFIALCEAHPSLLKDPKMKSEFDEVARYLKVKLEKYNIENQSEVQSKLQAILDKEVKTQKSPKIKMGKVKVKKIQHQIKLTIDPINLDESQAQVAEVKREQGFDISDLKVAVNRVSTVGEIEPAVLENIQQELNTVLGQCQELYDTGDFQKLEALVFETIAALPELPILDEDVEIENTFWGQFRDYAVMAEASGSPTHMEMLGKYLFETQRDLHDCIKNSAHITAFAKLFAVSDAMQDPARMKEHLFLPMTNYIEALEKLHTTDPIQVRQLLNICEYFDSRVKGVSEAREEIDKTFYGGGTGTYQKAAQLFPLVYTSRDEFILKREVFNKVDSKTITDFSVYDINNEDDFVNFLYGTTKDYQHNSMRSIIMMTNFSFDPLNAFRVSSDKVVDEKYDLNKGEHEILKSLSGREEIKSGNEHRSFFHFPSRDNQSANNINKSVKGNLQSAEGMEYKQDRPTAFARNDLFTQDTYNYSNKMNEINISDVQTKGMVGTESYNSVVYANDPLYGDLKNTHIFNKYDNFTCNWSRKCKRPASIDQCLRLATSKTHYINEQDFYQFVLDSFGSVGAIKELKSIRASSERGFQERIQLLCTNLQKCDLAKDEVGVIFHYQLLFSLAFADPEGMEKIPFNNELNITCENIHKKFHSYLNKCGEHSSAAKEAYLAQKMNMLNAGLIDQESLLDDDSIKESMEFLLEVRVDPPHPKYKRFSDMKAAAQLHKLCLEYIEGKEDDNEKQQLIEGIASKFLGPPPYTSNGFEITNASATTVNLMDLCISEGGVRKVRLPLEIRTFIEDSEAFSNQIKSSIKDDPYASMRDYKSSEGELIRAFVPVGQENLRFVWQASGLEIQKKNDEGRWLSVVDKSILEEQFDQADLGAVFNRLTEGKSIWIDSNKPKELFIEDNENQTTIYRCVIEKKKDDTFKITKIESVANKGSLSTLEDLGGNQASALTDIAGKDEIQVWAKNGKVKEVVYTNIQIGKEPLRYELKGSKLVGSTEDIKGYELIADKKAFIRKNNLTLVIPDEVGEYHLLVKEEGNVAHLKVIFPKYQRVNRQPGKVKDSDFQRTQIEDYHKAKFSSRSYADINKGLDSTEDYFIADIGSEGKFIALDKPEDLAYMTYVHIASKSYAQAKEFWDNAKGQNDLTSPKLAHVLRLIDQWPDRSAEALAFKLEAKAMMIQNSIDANKSLDMSNLGDLENEMYRLVELKQQYNKAVSNKDFKKTYSLSKESLKQVDRVLNLSNVWGAEVEIQPWMALTETEGEFQLPIDPEAVANGLWIETRSRSKRKKQPLLIDHNSQLTKGAQSRFRELQNELAKGHQYLMGMTPVLDAEKKKALASKIESKSTDGDYTVNQQSIIYQAIDILDKPGQDGMLRELHEAMDLLGTVLTPDDFKEVAEEALLLEKRTKLGANEEVSDEELKSMDLFEIYLEKEDGTSEHIKDAIEEGAKNVKHLTSEVAGMQPTKALSLQMQTMFLAYSKSVQANPYLLKHEAFNFPENWGKQLSFLEGFKLGRMMSAGDEENTPPDIEKLAGFFHSLEDYFPEQEAPEKVEVVSRQDQMLANVVKQHNIETKTRLSREKEQLFRLEEEIESIANKTKVVTQVETRADRTDPKPPKRMLNEDVYFLPKEEISEGGSQLDAYITQASSLSTESQVALDYVSINKEELKDPILDQSTVQTVVNYYADMVVFAEEQPPKYDYEVTSKGLKKLEKDLTKQIDQRKQEGVVSNLRDQILEFIKPDISAAQKAVQQDFKLVPDRLVGLYVAGSFNNKNSDEIKVILEESLGYAIDVPKELNLEELDGLLAKYLRESVFDKHLKYVRSEVSDYSKEDLNDPESMKALDQLLDIKRQFNDEDNSSIYRNLLAIEYVNGFILRKSQVDTIKSMLSEPNSVRQLGMGEGKSSVLLPFLLNHYADGNHLAIGMVPDELFAIVTEDLLYSCKEIFGQNLIPFSFDRNSEMSLTELTELLYTVKSAVKDKNPILTTRTSMLSFRDRYIELIVKQKQLQNEILTNRLAGEIDSDSILKLQDLELQLALFSEVLDLFKENGKVIGDEVHKLLDVTQEYNYPIEDPAGIAPKLQKDVVNVFKKLGTWQTQGGDKEKFFNKLVNNQQATMSSKEVNNLLNLIASDYYEQMDDALNLAENGISLEAFCLYMTEPNPSEYGDELKSLVDLLQNSIGEGNEKNENQSVIELLNVHNILCDVFPNLLTKTNLEHFGRDSNNLYTVPYFAAGTPSKSEYASVLQRLAYVGLDYFQKGISEKQCKSFVEKEYKEYLKFFDDLPADPESEEWGDLKKPAEEFARAFKEKYGVNIQEAYKDPESRKICLNAINASMDAKLEHLEQYVLPKMTINETQVSSNVFDLVSMFSEFNGFSGTTSTVDTFHRKLNTDKAKKAGTDGRSGLFLVEQSKNDNISITTLKDAPAEGKSMLEHVMGDTSPAEFLKKYDCIIDVGAGFKDYSPKELSGEIVDLLEGSGKKAVVYVDQSNTKMVDKTDSPNSEKLSDNKDLKPEDCFTIYDQAHITGTDIKQKKGARALLFLGSTTITDLQQAMWRMRGLLNKGQTVDIVVTESVQRNILDVRKQFINTLQALANENDEWEELLVKFQNLDKDKVTIDDVILYTNYVQDQQVKSLNLQKEISEMKEMVVDAKLEGFRRYYLKNKMSVTTRQAIQNQPDFDKIQSNTDEVYKHKAHQVMIDLFDNDLLQKMKYDPKSTIEKAEYGKTFEELQNIKDSYEEEIQFLSDAGNIYDKAYTKLLEGHKNYIEASLAIIKEMELYDITDIQSKLNEEDHQNYDIQDAYKAFTTILDDPNLAKLEKLNNSCLFMEEVSNVADILNEECKNFAAAINERYTQENEAYTPLDESLLPEMMPKSGLSDMDKVSQQEVDVDVDVEVDVQSTVITEQEIIGEQERVADPNARTFARDEQFSTYDDMKPQIDGEGLPYGSRAFALVLAGGLFVKNCACSKNVFGHALEDRTLGEQDLISSTRSRGTYMMTVRTGSGFETVLVDTLEKSAIQKTIANENIKKSVSDVEVETLGFYEVEGLGDPEKRIYKGLKRDIDNINNYIKRYENKNENELKNVIGARFKTLKTMLEKISDDPIGELDPNSSLDDHKVAYQELLVQKYTHDYVDAINKESGFFATELETANKKIESNRENIEIKNIELVALRSDLVEGKTGDLATLEYKIRKLESDVKKLEKKNEALEKRTNFLNQQQGIWLGKKDDLLEKVRNKEFANDFDALGEVINGLWSELKEFQKDLAEIQAHVKNQEDHGYFEIYDIGTPGKTFFLNKENDPFMDRVIEEEMKEESEYINRVKLVDPFYKDQKTRQVESLKFAAINKCFNGHGSLSEKNYNDLPSEWELILDHCLDIPPFQLHAMSSLYISKLWDGESKGNVYQLFKSISECSQYNTDEIQDCFMDFQMSWALKR